MNIVLCMCISILQTFPVLLERTGDTVSYMYVHIHVADTHCLVGSITYT